MPDKDLIAALLKGAAGLSRKQEAQLVAVALAVAALFLAVPGGFWVRLALAEAALLGFLLVVHFQDVRKLRDIEAEKETLHGESMKLAMDLMVGVTFIVEKLNEMAAGDLKVRFPNSDNDLLQALIQSLNTAVDNIGQAVALSQRTAVEVMDRATELANISHQYMAAIEQLTSSCTGISNSVINQNDCVQDTTRLAEELKAIANSRRQEMGEFGRKMHSLKDIVVQTGETAVLLHGKSAQIQNVVNRISDINRRNTILSINAAIEASRSGESQSGFRVIANEFKSLAENSELLAKEAEDDLGNISLGIARLREMAEQASGLMQPSFDLSLSM